MGKIEGMQLVTRKSGAAHDEAGALQADWCGMFDGKKDGLGGCAECARALRQCSDAIAAEKELGASVVV